MVLSPKATQRLTVFAKKVGRGINRFNMIADGDHILIAVSGGKDSLALCAALVERKKWVPIRYDCTALHIEWREYPLEKAAGDRLAAFLDRLNIPLIRVQADMFPSNGQKSFNCYICSRKRKHIFFQEAEKRGISKIALGHHLDDIIETTLLNLFFRGEFSTMMPVQDFFQGLFQIIRPMCEVEESEIIRLDKYFPLPIVSIDCPRKQQNQRVLLKSVIQRMESVNKQVKQNLYRAAWRVNPEYLPSALTPGNPGKEGF